jgi:hypothetical protein
MSDKRKEDLYSIGAIYGDMLNGLKPMLVKEEKTVPVGEIGNADLITKDSGPTERGGFKPSGIDIDVMTDKEKAENLYNIKGLTYGDGNNPGMGNQEPQPTGPEFGQVSYTGNVGGPEEDEESLPGRKMKTGGKMKGKSSSSQDYYEGEGEGEEEVEDEENEENEEDEEFLSEHGKNARRSLNNFMAKQSVFDKLYNKVMVSEEFEEEFSETEDLEALGITEEEPEDITVTLPSDLAQTLCDILQAALDDQEVEVETEVDVDETETIGFEEDEEAVMKDGGGYGVDAGSTLKGEVNYGRGGQNKVGNLKPTGAAKMKDGGGYGVDAGSTLHHKVDHALKNNKVGNLPVGKNAFE